MSNNLFPSKKQKLSLLVLVNVPESRLRDEAWDRERERGKEGFMSWCQRQTAYYYFLWQLKSLLKYAVLALAFITEETVKGVTYTKTP
jgi:hypothetical protein